MTRCRRKWATYACRSPCPGRSHQSTSACSDGPSSRGAASWSSADEVPPAWTTRRRTALTRRGCSPEACRPKQARATPQLRQSSFRARYTMRSVPSAAFRRSCGRRIFSAGQRSVPSARTVKACPVKRPLARAQSPATSSGPYVSSWTSVPIASGWTTVGAAGAELCVAERMGAFALVFYASAASRSPLADDATLRPAAVCQFRAAGA